MQAGKNLGFYRGLPEQLVSARSKFGQLEGLVANLYTVLPDNSTESQRYDWVRKKSNIFAAGSGQYEKKFWPFAELGRSVRSFKFASSLCLLLGRLRLFCWGNYRDYDLPIRLNSSHTVE